VSDVLVSIVVKTLPQKGSLKLDNNAVILEQIIPVSELNKLTFIPETNKNGVAEFTFLNNDGMDNSVTSYKVTVNILPVNDAPDFNIPATINVDEDFTPEVIVQLQPAPIPEDEISQVVTYAIQPETSDNLVINFNAATGKLVLTSVPDKFGEVDFTITANDGQLQHNIVSKTVKVNIAAVNDAPVLSVIPDQETEYKTALPAIVFSVADVDNPIESVELSATSDNQELIKNTSIVIQGTGNERSITISHEANLLGDALITLSASDGSATTLVEFNVNVFSITAIPESVNHAVDVFPNPFTSSLNVNFTEAYHSLDRGQTKLILHDALGRVVIKTSITQHKSTVDLEQLRDGIYMISIVDNNGGILFHTRVVKN
jgi:hypothetical protein